MISNGQEKTVVAVEHSVVDNVNVCSVCRRVRAIHYSMYIVYRITS